MKKIEKELRALRDQQESEILRRVLFWLGAAVVLEALVLLVNRFFFHYRASEIGTMYGLFNVLNVMQFLGFILAGASIIWAVIAMRKDPKRGVFRMILGAVFAAISVIAILFLHVGAASVSVLLVAIPSFGGLIMVYYLYQREFFLVAFLSGVGILGLWISKLAAGQHQTLLYTYLALGLIFTLLSAGLMFPLKKNDGTVKLGGQLMMIFMPDASYKAVWVTCGLVALALVLPLIAGAAVIAHYAILAIVVWLFVMAVYFTSRLM